MSYREQYLEQGFISPVDILKESQAAEHRRRLEQAESRVGSLHYLSKIHTVHTSPVELASHPAVLDLVEQILGPDILVYNVTYIIKEPHSASHVTWHQDLTYWGLDSDQQVSMWLALSPANSSSGCMRVIPGSHRQGRCHHVLGEDDETNVLYRSQRIEEVDESGAVFCELEPGQASFHHGWLLHDSPPNQTGDRRIGLNVQYVAPQVRQTKIEGYSAWLVRGEDKFGHYRREKIAQRDLDPKAMDWRLETERMHRGIVAND